MHDTSDRARFRAPNKAQNSRDRGSQMFPDARRGSQMFADARRCSQMLPDAHAIEARRCSPNQLVEPTCWVQGARSVEGATLWWEREVPVAVRHGVAIAMEWRESIMGSAGHSTADFGSAFISSSSKSSSSISSVLGSAFSMSPKRTTSPACSSNFLKMRSAFERSA